MYLLLCTNVDSFGIEYRNMRTYLNCLVFQRFVRIMYVLERNPVELTLVDVGDAIIFAPLRTAARCLQVVFKAIGGKPGRKNITLSNNYM